MPAKHDWQKMLMWVFLCGAVMIFWTGIYALGLLLIDTFTT